MGYTLPRKAFLYKCVKINKRLWAKDIFSEYKKQLFFFFCALSYTKNFGQDI